MRQIIAIGGMSPAREPSETLLEKYILDQARKDRPRICLVPTASGEDRARVLLFYETFTGLKCEPSWLSLFSPPTADLEGFLLEKDVILVSGGNTRSMLALWREWNLDVILRKAYENGAVLAGSSAGANCWFEECTTDSVPGKLLMLRCLGFLAGSFTPHYDVEPGRRPTLHRLLETGGIVPGFAADNDVALRFVDEELAGCVAAREGARAYRVSKVGETVVEEALRATDLSEE